MNDILKQRLVGALILVALGVVFWPIIFVEPGERSALGQGRIPSPPLIDATPIEPPDPTGLRASPDWQPDGGEESGELVLVEEEPADPNGTLAVPAEDLLPPDEASAGESRTRPLAPEQAVLDSRGVPVAWMLQVASVSSAAKAEQLRDRLLGMQETAYVKKLVQGDRELYRVYIGPKFERAQLEKIQGGIDARFGVNSMIVRYIP